MAARCHHYVPWHVRKSINCRRLRPDQQFRSDEGQKDAHKEQSMIVDVPNPVAVPTPEASNVSSERSRISSTADSFRLKREGVLECLTGF